MEYTVSVKQIKRQIAWNFPISVSLSIIASIAVYKCVYQAAMGTQKNNSQYSIKCHQTFDQNTLRSNSGLGESINLSLVSLGLTVLSHFSLMLIFEMILSAVCVR